MSIHQPVGEASEAAPTPNFDRVKAPAARQPVDPLVAHRARTELDLFLDLARDTEFEKIAGVFRALAPGLLFAAVLAAFAGAVSH